MKKLIFASILGLGLIAFTGCTTGNNADTGMKCQAGKCQTGKCKGAKKCTAGSKCGDAKKVAKKCQSGKCGEGK